MVYQVRRKIREHGVLKESLWEAEFDKNFRHGTKEAKSNQQKSADEVKDKEKQLNQR